MKKNLIFLTLCAVVFLGCSPKSQIAPSGDEYQVSREEIDFRGKKDLNKKIDAAYTQGKSAGYEEAKVEFEKIIPYIEAIRASAELQNSGGLCLPPLFLDKSNSRQVAVVLGEAHVCETFTVENVLAAVKSGIPGMPKNISENNSKNSDNKINISSVSLAGTDAKDFFIETAQKVEQQVRVAVLDTHTNREILRNSNFKYTKSEIGDNNSLVVEFSEMKEAKAFCDKYAICKGEVTK